MTQVSLKRKCHLTRIKCSLSFHIKYCFSFYFHSEGPMSNGLVNGHVGFKWVHFNHIFLLFEIIIFYFENTVSQKKKNPAQPNGWENKTHGPNISNIFELIFES